MPVVYKFGLPRHSHTTMKVVEQNRKLKDFVTFYILTCIWRGFLSVIVFKWIF